jgi:hypothetical protein
MLRRTPPTLSLAGPLGSGRLKRISFSRIGYSLRRGDSDFVVSCFANPADAEALPTASLASYSELAKVSSPAAAIPAFRRDHLRLFPDLAAIASARVRRLDCHGLLVGLKLACGSTKENG